MNKGWRVNAEDIRDRESFQTWFDEMRKSVLGNEDDARKVAALLAHRAAMRAYPLISQNVINLGHAESTRDQVITAINRALLIISCVSKGSSQDFKIAAKAAADQATAVGADLRTAWHKVFLEDDGPGNDEIGNLRHALAHAVGQVTGFASTHLISIIILSISRRGKLSEAVCWSELRNDCRELQMDRTLQAKPMWSYQNPLEAQWVVLRAHLLALGSEWHFWIDWYEKSLTGEHQNWSLLREIALLPPEDWEKGPDHVNALIALLQVKHAVRATPNSEVISFNESTGRLRVDPITDLPRDYLQEAVDRLIDVLDLFDFAEDRANQYRALEAEHDIIAQAVEKYASRPRMLHYACIRALRRLDVKIRNGECPGRESDADIDDFYGTVLAVSVDLFERDPLVKEAVTHVASARLRDVRPDEAEALVCAADEVAAVSEGVLAEELPQDARIAVDPAASVEDRKHATYVTASRLLRAWLIVGRGYRGLKFALEEIEGLTKTAVVISENARKIAVNTAGVGVAAAGLSCPIWLSDAIRIITGLF